MRFLSCLCAGPVDLCVSSVDFCAGPIDIYAFFLNERCAGPLYFYTRSELALCRTCGPVHVSPHGFVKYQ